VLRKIPAHYLIFQKSKAANAPKAYDLENIFILSEPFGDLMCICSRLFNERR